MKMFWTGPHRSIRRQLSAYIDGELDRGSARRLEDHLAGCEQCRLELRQLQATVSALRDLPEAEPPRSFTLSPERVAARRPSPAVGPLSFGMRAAAAAVAVALASVVVTDLSGVGGGGTEPAIVPGTVADRAAIDDDATPPALAPEDAEGERFQAGAATPTVPAEPSGEAPEAAPAAKGEGDGIDGLAAAEIGLAAALAVLVAGGLALAYTERKR